MDNPEKLTTLDTPDTGQINVRENRRGNQEWTVQRNWQHWVHKTQRRRQTNIKTQYVLGTTNVCIFYHLLVLWNLMYLLLFFLFIIIGM
jgi:hypothetical protein